MFDRLSILSCIAHDLIFDGPPQSLCARAWEHRHTRWGRVWVRLFGPDHCRRSFDYWRG